MPQDADPAGTAQRPLTRASLDFATDRTTAFRRAGRHTVLVRALRFVLPLAAVLLFAGYGLVMQRTFSFGMKDKAFGVDGVSISTQALVAHNPHYEGFDKQGGKFNVRAKTAEQGLGQKGPVALKSIDGQMFDAANSRTDLKATRGTFNTTSNVLELYEKIDVVSQNGMTAELTRATVLTKDGRITSDEPVLVRMPAGTVRGNAMTIEQKSRQILFSGGVIANLKQEPRPARPADPSELKNSATQPDQPVEITARQLHIDDNAKRATFAGDVVAKQNDAVMRTAELDISYEGQSLAGQSVGGAPPAGGAAATPSGKVRSMIAKSEVVIDRGTDRVTGSSGNFDAGNDSAVLLGPVAIVSGPDRKATSDRAEFDNKNDQVLLTGNVVVTQLKNVLKGRRLFADRKKGTLELSSPAVPGLGKGRITARLYQAESEAGSAAKPKRPAGQPATAAKSGAPQASLRADPDQPIDIEADTLDVDDKKKEAIFRGTVRAVQGDYIINTQELVATYTGESGMAMGAQPQAMAQVVPGTAQAKTGSQLQKVTAPKPVRIISTKDGQVATGNAAEFDTKANTAVLMGNVTLTQNGSVTTGPRALLDMASGTMKMQDASGFSASAPTAGAPGSGAAGGAPRSTGRAQLLIYPNQLKEDRKQEASKAKQAAGGGAIEATPGTLPDTTAKPAPRQRAWKDDESKSFSIGN